MPVTVPLLSTRATCTLFDDQSTRTVGITLPTRSNAVAKSPARSPTLRVIEGGATCTSATFCAARTPGRARRRAATRAAKTIAART